MLDSDTAKAVVAACLAALGTTTTWLYKGTHARIKRGEEELNRQRDHVVALFQEVAEVRKDMNGGFEAIRKDMHAAHVDLIERLPRG
jgi:uncharacterized membrane-anchored protein YhcB (DUF1043 family)